MQLQLHIIHKDLSYPITTQLMLTNIHTSHVQATPTYYSFTQHACKRQPQGLWVVQLYTTQNTQRREQALILTVNRTE